LNRALRSGDGVTRLHNRWTSVGPEVGIEPTTYRLQDGRYLYTMASTGDASRGRSIMNTTVRR
jgi:hypothetical protein